MLTLAEYEGLTFSFESAFARSEFTINSENKKPQTITVSGYAYGETAFFADVTGDGFRDFCVPFSAESGWVSFGIFVYDLKSERSYTLHERSDNANAYYMQTYNKSLSIIKIGNSSQSFGFIYVGGEEQELQFYALQTIDTSPISCTVNGKNLQGRITSITDTGSFSRETIEISFYEGSSNFNALYSGSWTHTPTAEAYRYRSFCLVKDSNGAPFIKAESTNGKDADYYKISIKNGEVVVSSKPAVYNGN